MKFTNAFLASLLFFGVTPLAIDKKRNEHALTTTSSPFATSSSVALVTPNGAGVGDITDGTHDFRKVRAEISRGGRRRKTTENTSTRKRDSKTKTEPKPKGKVDVTCTAEQKKAGKCPNQKQNKNWEVLYPTKGCRPKSCKKCGKKTIRDLFPLRSPTLSKRAATLEPASKTEAGLMAWTKDVWASSPKVLPLAEDSFKPTSFFLKWTSLGQGTNFVTVKDLMGCASVVAVSDVGIYVSHHWQNTVGDAAYKELTPQFDNAFTNPLTGKRRASFKLTAAQRKIALEYMSEADVKSMVDDVFPTTGFEALTNVKSSFTAASNVQSMVAVWDGRLGSGDKYTMTGAHMKNFVDGLLPGTATKLVMYEITEDAKKTSSDENDYHGKVIVSYDSGTKKYQVWMPAAKLDGPILKN